MGRARLVLGVAAAGGAAVLLAGGGIFAWASYREAAVLQATYATHAVDFPVPFPLTRAERAALPEGADPGVVALERAVERGRHLVQARYACVECHGDDFSGGTMIDDPAVGQLLGPNLTLGRGGVTHDYTPTDWDRAVRHGVLPDGTASVMPSEDYLRMSDRELSDIVAYVRSFPPVDSTVPKSAFGPVGTLLVATGRIVPSALLAPHDTAHPLDPPDGSDPHALGQHLAQLCTGCHRAGLDGGPIPFGPPDWPAAANLTPHADGLGSWSFEDFARAMRTAERPDGTPIRSPMKEMSRYAANMTEGELRAMWTYLRSVPPASTGR